MPPQPAVMQVSAASRRFGWSPPRALRSTAILLRLTLRVVMDALRQRALATRVGKYQVRTCPHRMCYPEPRSVEQPEMMARKHKKGAERTPRRRVQSTTLAVRRESTGRLPVLVRPARRDGVPGRKPTVSWRGRQAA